MKIKETIGKHIQHCTLFYAVLSRPSQKNISTSKITIKLLETSKEVVYQMTKQCSQKVFHQNIKKDLLLEAIWPFIGSDFQEANFFTSEADYQILVSKKLQWTVINHKPTRLDHSKEHNRTKKHFLKEGTPVPFLIELGIMQKNGTVISKMSHKFKQINRFIEFIADVIPSLRQEGTLRMIDFGCGKSYLTFAMYHYLHSVLKRSVKIIGLDLKADVINNCQALAAKIGYEGLEFQLGDINSLSYTGYVDMVVSLHACDTATDAALEKAIQWKADVILCVPCCQHELYPQIKQSNLSPVLKHGILKERFAALVTDAARAALLDIAGYQTKVIEFIDMEHTPKNLLIRAVRVKKKQESSHMIADYHAFKELLHIEPSLEKRLQHLLSL